jgi:hypothetical protein
MTGKGYDAGGDCEAESDIEEHRCISLSIGRYYHALL